MKKLLIIGASILQVPAIKKAKEMGFYVGVIDYNPNAVGVPMADQFFNVSTIDIEGVADAAKRFAYVLKDFTRAYIMDKITYIAFIKAFGTVTRESEKNGGAEKIRLKSESKAMLEWLMERV